MSTRFVFERLKPKRWKDETWKWAQPKFNGWHVTAFKDQAGGTSIFSRSLRATEEYIKRCPKIVELPGLYEFIKYAPPLSAIDGELFPGDGSHPSQVPTLLKEDPYGLTYTCFAVPKWGGASLTYADVDSALRLAESIGVKCSTRLSWQFMPSDREHLLRMAEQQSLEGWVLKRCNYWGWFKLKIERTIDCIVLGWVPGKGKYQGMVGALRVGLRHPDRGLVEIGRASGMADSEREKMTDIRGQLVGFVCEIEYQDVTPYNRLQHARFNRWRPDKETWECTWEQLLS